ncbi:MAG: pseudouridine synthase [Candidatus Marinimicrobia bacterium]|nr:pseudouridine synthase [Candidatus Neomarinimicrobiota bacterium]
MKIRIAKFISNAGYCSRRDAEKLVFNGKVYINGSPCLHPSQKVSDEDTIKIENKILKNSKKIELWKMYKPIKYICSTKDKLKRNKIFDLLPKSNLNLISVGRLDYMSEGLILFTNSGEYSRFLELPSSNIERIYRVCVSNIVKNVDIKKINKGIKINEIQYNKVKLIIEKKTNKYVWLIFKLKEGKNREIRNICNFFSWKIVKLIRIQFGPYKLGGLKIGKVEKIKIIKND